ncbi:MAG: CoA pyrophosphatase [Burkholderiales bacterium]|nr:MAG: CoA pyrophosphatase [Burkholderiales bacterium]
MSAADRPPERAAVIRAAAEPGTTRRSIPDPRTAPIDDTAPAMPGVSADRLRPEALRERFRRPPVWTPEFIDDRWRLGPETPRPAAVLVPLVPREHGLSVMLTVRTAHLSAHAGQIAFPGGRTEPHDGSPVGTALRETEEEIGLARALVEVLGQMPTYTTGTGFVVTPVVGLVDPDHALAPDANEVAEVFEVPLAFLMDPGNHQRRLYRWDDGLERSFLAMPWTRPGDGREFFVWGVTAAMLRNLYRYVAA